MRRAVIRRDGGRCVFPGCRCGVFLDVHHVKAREEGGSHDAENLLTVCAAHHRALHRGEVSIEGSLSTGLVFRHADGSTYGSSVSAKTADARAGAFRALRSMGFRESEVRRALERVGAGAGGDASVGALIRRSLLALTGGGERAA